MKTMFKRLAALALALLMMGAALPMQAETVPAATMEAPAEAVVESAVEPPPAAPEPPPADIPAAPQAAPMAEAPVVTEKPTPVPTEQPTEQPTQEPTPTPTEKPTEQPTQQPTAVPTETPTEQPTTIPTEKPTAEPAPGGNGAQPTGTPVPVSRLQIQGQYDLVDRSNTIISVLKKGEYADITVYLRDAGITSDAAGTPRVTMEQDVFQLVPVQHVPAYDGQPLVRKTSSGGNDLAFSITFPNAQYLGEKNTLRFSVQYSGAAIQVPGMEVIIRECMVNETTTPTPAGEEPAPTPAPGGTGGTADPAQPTPNPTDTGSGSEPTDPPAATPTATPLVSKLSLQSYDVLDSGGNPLSQINAKAPFTLILHLQDANIQKQQNGTFAAFNSDGNFASASLPQVDVFSAPDAPLEMSVTFDSLTWKGGGNQLDMTLSYQDAGLTGSVSLAITQCKAQSATNTPVPTAQGTPAPGTTQQPAASAAPTATAGAQPTATAKPQSPAPSTSQPADPAGDPDATPVPLPQPVVMMTRGDMSAVKPKQEFTVDVYFLNMGKTAVEMPVATFTTSDGMMLKEKSSFALEKILPGQTYNLRLHMQALDEVASQVQYLEASLKFEFDAQGVPQQGTAQERIFLPVAPADKVIKAPSLQMGRTDFGGPVTAGQVFDVTLWVRNTGTVSAVNAVANLSPSEALMLLEASSSAHLGTIEPGKTASVNVKMQAMGEIQSAAQFLQADLKYDFLTDKSAESGNLSEKITIPAVIKIKRAGGGGGSKPVPEPSVPNIIISKYDYGAGQIAAGAEFPLTLTFKNTSAIQGVENIMLTLETGEGLSITSESNTVYVAAMAPGAQETKTIRMQALPGTKTDSVSLNVGFKYEYVAQAKRSSANLAEKLSIPIYQPDRMNINPPTGPESVTVGEEAAISLSYFNKGKGDVSNLSAEIVGDVKALSKVQNPGNIEPGKSGTIDFIVTPEEEGVSQFDINITYEDAAGETITRKYPVNLKVNGLPDLPAMEGDMPGEEEWKEDSPQTPWYVYAAPAAAVVALTGLALRGRRKKKMRQQDAFRFDDDLENGSHA